MHMSECTNITRTMTGERSMKIFIPFSNHKNPNRDIKCMIDILATLHRDMAQKLFDNVKVDLPFIIHIICS